jgi:adenylate kinase
VCRAAGHIYNLQSSQPKRPGHCDVDGSPLYMRDDDRPETVLRRLQVYREQTEPLLAFYETRGLFVRVDAEGDVGRVAEALLALVAPQRTR